MSGRLMAWTSMNLGRRRFLQGGLATVFGAMAAVAAGRLPVEASNDCPCSGPLNSGYCGSGLCNGPNCSHSGFTYCSLTTAFCAGGGCWTCNGSTCCDCACNGGGSSWYCYCGG